MPPRAAARSGAGPRIRGAPNTTPTVNPAAWACPARPPTVEAMTTVIQERAAPCPAVPPHPVATAYPGPRPLPGGRTRGAGRQAAYSGHPGPRGPAVGVMRTAAVAAVAAWRTERGRRERQGRPRTDIDCLHADAPCTLIEGHISRAPQADEGCPSSMNRRGDLSRYAVPARHGWRQMSALGRSDDRFWRARRVQRCMLKRRRSSEVPAHASWVRWWRRNFLCPLGSLVAGSGTWAPGALAS